MLNWSEYKRFIIIAGAVLLVWLLTYLIIIGPARQKTFEARSESELIQKKIDGRNQAGQMQDDRNINSVMRERERMEEQLSELKQKMLFQLHPRYKIDPEDQDVLIKFHMLLQERKNLLKKSATRQGIVIPDSFGFPTRNILPSALPGYFEQLDIIEQVIDLAIDYKVAEVLSINQTKDSQIFLGGVNLENEFLKYCPVVIRFRGDFKSISGFLYQALVGSRFLSLVRVSLQNNDPNVDAITLTLAVGSLRTQELPSTEDSEDADW